MPYKTFAKQIIKEMMDQLGEGKPIRGRKPIKKKKRKELQGSISRKEAEKKFKEMKNPEDWKNPDYYEKKAGGGIYIKKKPKPKHKKDDFELPKKYRTPRGGYGKYDVSTEKEVMEEKRLLRDRIKELEEKTKPTATGQSRRPSRSSYKSHGGKVDNSGQHFVAKQYGGKVK